MYSDYLIIIINFILIRINVIIINYLLLNIGTLEVWLLAYLFIIAKNELLNNT